MQELSSASLTWGEAPTPSVQSPSLLTPHWACEAEAGSPPQAVALRSMAESHLEAGGGRTLALIRVWHRAELQLLAAIDWTGGHNRPSRNQSLMRLDGLTQEVLQTRFYLKAIEAHRGGALASPANEWTGGDNEPIKQEHVRENIRIKAQKCTIWLQSTGN